MPAGVRVELDVGLWLLVGAALPHWQVPVAQTLGGAREEPSPEPQGLPAFLPAQRWTPRRVVFTSLSPPLLPAAWLGGGWAPSTAAAPLYPAASSGTRPALAPRGGPGAPAQPRLSERDSG